MEICQREGILRDKSGEREECRGLEDIEHERKGRILVSLGFPLQTFGHLLGQLVDMLISRSPDTCIAKIWALQSLQALPMAIVMSGKFHVYITMFMSSAGMSVEFIRPTRTYVDLINSQRTSAEITNIVWTPV